MSYSNAQPVTQKKNNSFALAGFVLGLASIFLYWIGILPVLGIVFSAIGLGTFDENIHQKKWMAGCGLGLNIVFTLMYISYYGHLR